MIPLQHLKEAAFHVGSPKTAMMWYILFSSVTDIISTNPIFA